ncbi:retrotransposable element ORF2 protein, partial [Plecturocebus cupreus]
MEYYTAIKNDEFMSFAGTWMKMETIIFSKLTQEQETQNHIFSLIKTGWSQTPGLNDSPDVAFQSTGIIGVSHCAQSLLSSSENCLHKNEDKGWAWWLMPVIPALWEARVGGSQGQEFKTSLANMGWTQWWTPVISALWETKMDRSSEV